MRNTRRRKTEGRPRPSVSISTRQPLAEYVKRALRALLVPPSRLFALYQRLRRKAHALGLLRTCRPQAATVGVGGLSADCRGRVLLTSWLLGWAKARGVGAAVAGPLGDGHPPALPFQVTPGGDPAESGIEAALLASYDPAGRFIIDSDPARAATTAVRSFAPDLLLLEDVFADARLAKDIELAILTPDDLGPGWDKVFPAGAWRLDATALARASAFCVFAGPLSLDAAMETARTRLAPYGRPVFGLTFSIWRWRGPDGPASAETLAEEPYIAVLGASDRDILPELLRRNLGASPRLAFFIHDRHRFTRQDFENLRADAERLRVKTILTSPRLALKLRQGGPALDGYAVWTYDPEVVFGPTLFTDVPFLSWWEAAYRAVSRERHTA
jgi:tetraacyldisaccharide 4'-kinase